MDDWEHVLDREYVLANGYDNLGFELEDTLKEDLGIIQPDGSRACVEYELIGKGFSLVDVCVNSSDIF